MSPFAPGSLRVLALSVAVLCGAALLATVGPAGAQAGDYPAPKVLIEHPTPFLPGQTATVTTNEYAGPKADGGPIDVFEQCYRDSCVRLAQHVQYLEPVNVVPRRAIVVNKKLFDCAANTGSCVIRLWGHEESAVPLNFAKATSALPKESTELSKTDGLTNNEPVELTVKSSLKTPVFVYQCASKAGRPMCKRLVRRHLAGDASGETATRTITVRPSRILAMKQSRTADCGKDNPRRGCYLVVRTASDDRSTDYRIGQRIPITFDTSQPLETPRVAIPEGPYVDGQMVKITVQNLLPGTRVIARCNYNTNREACGKRTRARADANGNAELTLKLSKIRRCMEAKEGSCEIVVDTNPRTVATRSVVVFE